MAMGVKANDVVRCNLKVSSRLKKNKPQMVAELDGFLNASPLVDVYMERLSDGQANQRRVSLYFDSEIVTGTRVMECDWTGNGFEVEHSYVTKKRLQLGNNRHMQLRLSFDRQGLAPSEMTLELYRIIQSLPIASERTEYVKKRISSWEAYLQVMERNADVEKLEIGIRMSRLSPDFRKVTFELQKLPNGFDKYYKKSAVRLVQTSQSLGNVVQVHMGKRTIDVELNRDLQEKARAGKWNVPSGGKLAFDNVAEMAQINRLKDGFKRLENGWAVNPNLEKLLFEKRPVVRKRKVEDDLEFKQNLNEFQQQAVTGAIAANDLYVIQGPPGTGKTTVITEICYQNAKMGLKTLVASQSNLAVDNALGKLMTDQEIRILRIGRSESIEEEGKRFVEEQVALYWKEQTLASIQTHVNQFEKEGQTILVSIEKTEETLANLLKKKATLEIQVQEKKEAKAKLTEVENEVGALTSTIREASRKKEQFVEQLEMSRDLLEDAKSRHKRAQEQVVLFSGTGEFSRVQGKIEEDIHELENQLTYVQTETMLHKKRMDRQGLVDKLTNVSRQQVTLKGNITRIATIKKLDELKMMIRKETGFNSQEVQAFIRQLERLQVDYQASHKTVEQMPELDDTLNKAIHYANEKLIAQSYNMKMLGKKISMIPLHESTKAEDVHLKKVVDDFREFAKKMNGFSEPLNQSGRQTLAAFYEQMVVLRKSRTLTSRSQRQPSSGNERLKKEILETFEKLKGVIKLEMEKRVHQLNEELSLGQTRLEKLDAEISEGDMTLSNLWKSMTQNDGFATMEDMKKMLAEKQQDLQQMGTEKDYVDALVLSENKQKEAVFKRNQEMKQFLQIIEEREHELANQLANQRALNEQKRELEAIVMVDVEALLTQVQSSHEETAVQLAELKRQETFLEVSNDIRLEWQDMLEQSSAFDLDEIKKLYIQYANVIGVTCSISASKDFVTQYPDFDVVIIDEVSKATPPELLLPMLKGKKIILVGDHHQLPPLVGQDTMDEVLEDMKDPKEQAELKAILKESIFERLFKDLPDDSKTTLRIQYRMHEHIMETINPFYQEKNYGLSCGLVDSDNDRNHLLDGTLFKQGQHIVWYDMPNKRGYLEEREQHNRSYYNPAELKQIRELLLDLNEATATAKRQGRIALNAKKKVGIISFYGEQVKRIDRLLSQELDLPHLHCRTGTVDKFQGMEMDVIILSFVRNHLQPDGNIGFLKDYRRLNVALSRARELLMIVGSVEMFTRKTKGESQKEMFGHVLNVVKKHGGLKELETTGSGK